MIRQAASWAVALIFFSVLGVSASDAETCLAPSRPFVPSDPADAREYADLIRQDFETYLAKIQGYFRCLDAERVRAFNEAQEVSEEYGRFIETVRR
jgi:hypothetical protein